MKQSVQMDNREPEEIILLILTSEYSDSQNVAVSVLTIRETKKDKERKQ